MDSNLKIALVGYGRFGKKYYKTLKRLNLSIQIIIFKKKNYKKLHQDFEREFKKK